MIMMMMMMVMMIMMTDDDDDSDMCVLRYRVNIAGRARSRRRTAVRTSRPPRRCGLTCTHSHNVCDDDDDDDGDDDDQPFPLNRYPPGQGRVSHIDTCVRARVCARVGDGCENGELMMMMLMMMMIRDGQIGDFQGPAGR